MVILLRVLARCRSGRNKISIVRSLIILRSGERVTSFTKDNSANISSEKWENEAFREVYILRIREKTSSQISHLSLDLLQVDLLASEASLVWPRSGRPRATKSREVRAI